MTEKKKKRRKRRVNTINRHHVNYKPEVMAYIFQGEHMVVTHLQRRTKNISKGFVDCLLLWLEENAHKAQDITDNSDKRIIWNPDNIFINK